LHLAKKAKAKGAGFNKLDSLVSKCYSLKLNSIIEINDYFDNLDYMFDVAKTVCKNLGLRYDNLEVIVDNYIAVWVNLGFEVDAIIKIANYCFKFSIRTLEGMNGKINQLFKLGLLTSNSIDEYLDDLAKNDDKILVILQKLGIDRCVNSNDRNMYRIWLYTWQMSEDLIAYATDKSIGMSMPIQYLNKLLSTYYSKKITTVEQAKEQENSKTQTKKKDCEKAKGGEYSKQQLNSLINNLFEVEI